MLVVLVAAAKNHIEKQAMVAGTTQSRQAFKAGSLQGRQLSRQAAFKAGSL
jgi:hypothetical protein